MLLTSGHPRSFYTEYININESAPGGRRVTGVGCRTRQHCTTGRVVLKTGGTGAGHGFVAPGFVVW